MKFTYYGQSCFSLSDDSVNILFDPFITGNELAKDIDFNAIEADYILLSHGHTDHILDCEAIALRTGAKVVCNWEIHAWLNGKGVTNTHPMNTGGKWTFDEFSVKCVVAQHSSCLPDGSYGGNPMGFIIYKNSETYYYSGDTALTMDMQLIPLWANPKVGILPIGDNFTMGIEDAIQAAKFAKITNVIGVHFDTFGFIKIDHDEAKRLFSQAGIQFTLPTIGEAINL